MRKWECPICEYYISFIDLPGESTEAILAIIEHALKRHCVSFHKPDLIGKAQEHHRWFVK